jgi:DNA modification methylase
MVMDPFTGLGSTAVACARLGLGFIGSDLDEVYLNAAIERVQDAGKPRMAKAGLKSAKWLKANG